MTKEKLQSIFENSNDSQWKGDNCFQGLQIIAKYVNPFEKDLICAAEHDVIYSVQIEELLEKLTEEDAIILAKLNWSLGDECLICYV